MSNVTADRFDEYFERLHGHSPYPWQRRLAARAAEGSWPRAINLPTGSGKTACLDVAVFALACHAYRPVEQRRAPRRIFFSVNRRVIVDEAYERARRIAADIWRGEAEGDSILADVAEALRMVAGTVDRPDLPPLDVLELRGGIYRDNRWARSITQPTIVCTTLDQLGSRLLFRGYGVSPGAAPIHAALIAYDSLVLLDEAHISEPFRQTLEFVAGYLEAEKWAEQPIGPSPLVVVPMTATPPDDLPGDQLAQLQDDDRAVTHLSDRLTASKPAELRQVKNLTTAAVDAAVELAKEDPVAVGIIVNRVATARAIYRELRQLKSNKKSRLPADATVELVIGSMRPVDRDELAQRLRPLVGPDRPKPRSERASFVVATQCLEVGADYDFDVLITECASLDALRQRFGRLNRAGRAIQARGIVLADTKHIAPEDQLDDAEALDPIYGNALARTWNWLAEVAREVAVEADMTKLVDFGIDALSQALLDTGAARASAGLLAPAATLDAPVMMPAYLDLWCQTAPRPALDPDVSWFIHGSTGGEPDVQVCWRSDLVEDAEMQANHWCDVVALLPPTSAECMRVPISRMRRWLKGNAQKEDATGDLIGEAPGDTGTDEMEDSGSVPKAILWRGARKSLLLQSVRDLRPGDTIVLPGSGHRYDLLGHLPELYRGGASDEEHHPGAGQLAQDHGETAFALARDRAALRLHPALRDRLGPAFGDLLAAAEQLNDEPIRREQWRGLLREAGQKQAGDTGLKRSVRHLAESGLRIEPYPDGRGVVLTSRNRLESGKGWFLPVLPATDDGEDEASLIERQEPVLLAHHIEHVVDAAEATCRAVPLSVSSDVFVRAAALHDLGKADERFQAVLRRSDRTDVWLFAGVGSVLWAKSEGAPLTSAQDREARLRAGLPGGFRHEMLSIQLAEHGVDLLDEEAACEILLHVIAAHHGHSRPFAPVVSDQELPAVSVDGIELSHDQRVRLVPPHRLDSGIAERFWRLTRRYGWWGLAYLEAVLRLADQQASADEDAGRYAEDSLVHAEELSP